MGLFNSTLSYHQREILNHSSGLKVDEICPLFPKIPVYKFNDRSQFQNHKEPNSIAFFLIRGQYIASAKSTMGGKIRYHL
jgi:hypothetical protein